MKCHTVLGVQFVRVFVAAVVHRRCTVVAACATTAEGHKLRPGGHMWPGELFNLAGRAFTIISLNAKRRGWSN